MIAADGGKRHGALLFGLLECLFLAGGMYGWVALVFMLKQDGVFSHLCETGRDNTTAPTVYPNCQEQDDRLNLVFTIGQFAFQGSTLITGALFDRFGLRITRVGGTLVYVAGCLMLGFTSVDWPYLAFPGLMCFGMGGIQLLVTNMQIGNFFTTLRLPVVTVYNAAFDTSATTPLIMKLMYESGIQRLHSFIGLALIATILVGTSTFFLLPKFKIIPRDKEQPKEMVKSEEGGQVARREEDSTMSEAPARSLRQCVFSPTYALAVFWHGLLQLRFFMYLGSLNVWLQLVTNNDADQISTFTNVFGAVMIGGLLMGPLEGFILAMEERRLKKDNMTYWRKLKTAAVPEFLCCLFGLILSVCNLFDTRELLYVQFITMTAMRSFLYGLNAAFLFLAFPGEHFGKLFGILMTCNAFVASTQYGLFKWSEGPPRDPFPVNIFLLVLVLLSFIQPIYLWFAEKISCLHKTSSQNGTTTDKYLPSTSSETESNVHDNVDIPTKLDN